MTGGYTKLELHVGRTLASTELMVEDSQGQATLWTEAGALPSPRQALRGVSLNNNIFMTGSVGIMVISWNNGKEVPRWGVAEIQKMSPSTTGRCYCCH